MSGAAVAFPGLFPPIAVAIPVIFAAAAPAIGTRLTIMVLGPSVLALNLLVMLFAKVIMRRISQGSLQVLGAVFGVLQAALGVEFVMDAVRLMQVPGAPGG